MIQMKLRLLINQRLNFTLMTISLLYHTWEQQLIRFTMNELSHDLTREKLSGESDDAVSAPPPLLIQYEEGKFYCTIQQEMLASLKQRKINSYPTIIVLKGNAEYKRFMKYYGNIFIYVNKV